MAKTLFDHINSIYQNQSVTYYDDLDEPDKKTFNVYMINRFISMHEDYLPVVNELQPFWNELGPRETYLFYSQLLPKKRIFAKYVKSTTEEKFEDWIIELVSKHYDVSTSVAREYISIFYRTPEGKLNLRELCEGYGIDQKALKKAKL